MQLAFFEHLHMNTMLKHSQGPLHQNLLTVLLGKPRSILQIRKLRLRVVKQFPSITQLVSGKAEAQDPVLQLPGPGYKSPCIATVY